jgi:hypothetical protein
MALGGIEGALSTVAACGGAGAFIDFWIGKRGEKRVRDWFETWWLRFSYITMKSFGREEALYAVGILDRLFGRRLFSSRRLVATVVVAFIVLTPTITKFVTHYNTGLIWTETPNILAIKLVAALLLFAMSISATRAVSVRASRHLRYGSVANTIIFILILGAQVIMYWLWVPFLALIVGVFARVLGVSLLYTPLDFDWFITYTQLYPQAINISLDDAINTLATIPTIGRIGLAAIFAGSYLMKPLHWTILTLFERIIENDKPIFTLLLGGGAAAAQAVEAVIHAL